MANQSKSMKKELTEDELKQIFDAIVSRRKIQAIKIYREATGEGLKEAKVAIEEITASLAEKHPELMPKNASGCLSLIIAGVILYYGVSELGHRLFPL